MFNPARAILLFAAVCAMISGCSRHNQGDAAAQQQILYLGNAGEPKDLDPNTQEAELEYVIESSLFEPLVNIANDGTTIIPGVASSWESSHDGRVYTFHLRPDARWSDGSPLLADDFVYSFRRLFTPSLGSDNNVYGFAIAGAEAINNGKADPDTLGVHAIDAHTLRIELAYRCPYILVILGGVPFVPVPRAVVEKYGNALHPGSPWSRPGNMVSNGPFILQSWRSNQDIVVRRNPQYWDAARTRLKEIHFLPVDDPDAEERMYRAGQLHVTFRLPAAKIAAYRDRHDPSYREVAMLNSVYLVLNTTVAPFSDLRLRRALALAIDRDRLFPTVGQGIFSVGHTLTRPGTAGYTPGSRQDYNPSLARQLLAEAGFPGGRGFPRVTLRYYPGSSPALAEAVQESWRKILGIDLSLQVQEQKTLFDAMKVKDYSIALMAFYYGVDAPECMLLIARSDSNYNWSGWKNGDFDAAYNAANTAGTDQQRMQAVERMEELLFAQAPYIPLAYFNQPHLVTPRLHGWRDNSIYAIDWRELYFAP